MEERLQKILAKAGYGSRRGCEEFITAGRVQVNGKKAKLGQKADALKDKITMDGKQISVVGHGEDNPIAIDLNPETRKYNRRVEFSIKAPGHNTLTIVPIQVPKAYRIK